MQVNLCSIVPVLHDFNLVASWHHRLVVWFDYLCFYHWNILSSMLPAPSTHSGHTMYGCVKIACTKLRALWLGVWLPITNSIAFCCSVFQCSLDGQLKQWLMNHDDIPSAWTEPLTTVLMKWAPHCLDHHPSSDEFLVGGAESCLLYSAIRMDVPIREWTWGQEPIHCAKFNQVEQNVACSLSKDNSLMLIDCRQDQPIRKVRRTCLHQKNSFSYQTIFTFLVWKWLDFSNSGLKILLMKMALSETMPVSKSPKMLGCAVLLLLLELSNSLLLSRRFFIVIIIPTTSLTLLSGVTEILRGR